MRLYWDAELIEGSTRVEKTSEASWTIPPERDEPRWGESLAIPAESASVLWPISDRYDAYCDCNQ